MKRLIGIASPLLLLFVSCGGAGSGVGDLTSATTVSKVEQDIICCITWDDTNNTCSEYGSPQTRSISVNLSKRDMDEEFTEDSDLTFEGCTVEFIPNPYMPDEAKDPKLLEEMKSYVFCSGSDIPADGSGTVEITYSQALLETIEPIYSNYGKSLTYTLKATVKYRMSDKEYKKIIEVPIDFANFVNTEHDMCEYK
ncbi:MAG: hypothetical protein ABGX17_06145 [Desulfurobacteriaceae bacterium]